MSDQKFKMLLKMAEKKKAKSKQGLWKDKKHAKAQRME